MAQLQVFDSLSRISDWALDCERTAAEWFYPEASRFVNWLAGVSNISVEQSASIIAVLSPRNTWLGNQHDAVGICLGSAFDFSRVGGKGYSAMPRDITRAKAIHSGATIADYLKGPKVNAFQRNLMKPYTDVGVPIDRHLTRAVYGHSMTDAQITHLLSVKGNYAKTEDVISTCALRLGYKPIVFANLLWYVIRRLSKNKSQHTMVFTDQAWRPVYTAGNYRLTRMINQDPSLSILPGCDTRPWLYEIANGGPRFGNETVDNRGRVRVTLYKGHKFANAGSYQWRSRLVMMYRLDRPIYEDVDHIDKDRSNDRISNLRLYDHGYHAEKHTVYKERDSNGRFIN